MAIKVEITPAKYGLTSREEADIASVCDKYDQTSFVFVALFVQFVLQLTIYSDSDRHRSQEICPPISTPRYN
jgi:hypothetical protein